VFEVANSDLKGSKRFWKAPSLSARQVHATACLSSLMNTLFCACVPASMPMNAGISATRSTHLARVGWVFVVPVAHCTTPHPHCCCIAPGWQYPERACVYVLALL
jgi:hypothetical protein